MKMLVFVLSLPLVCTAAMAAQPPTPEHWQTPPHWSAQTRERYQDLLSTLRCLVCQDESLASSSAPLAADLRRQIRKMMRQGKSNQQIQNYLVARYGDFVLYDPPFKPLTWVLWIGPFVLLGLGLTVVVTLSCRSGRDEPPLHADLENSKRLLADEEEKRGP